MRREELGDLYAFLAVVEDQSFTRAAARLGTSQSALSHTMRRLEERLGVRLLTRTTRNVSPTLAGEELADTLRPAFGGIADRLERLNRLRQNPAGTIRVTAGRYAADNILMPVATRLMARYPEVKFEISIDLRLVDIVAERFDAGIRLGDQIERDMVAVRVGPDLGMAVVGTPDYFSRHPIPQTPHDLAGHTCINLRLPTLGGLYAWEFEKDGRPLNIRVDGQFTCNQAETVVDATLAGIGLGCMTEDMFQPLIEQGRLVRVLQDWCPPFSGYHLYYPSRRQVSPAFELLVEGLRYRA